MLRVAFVVGEFPRPSETFIVRQIVGLLDRGCDVRIFAQMPGRVHFIDDVVRERELASRTQYRRPVPRGNLLGRIRAALGSRAAARSFDVIHAHFGPHAMVAMRERHDGRLGGPLLASFHGHDVHSFPRRHGRAVYSKLFRHAQWFTANTRFTAAAIAKLGCPRERTTILPMGLVLPASPAGSRPPRYPQRLLTIARHVEKKGLEYGIRAFAKLCARHSALVYDLAGDGPLRSRLERLARELGVGGRVRFLGWCSQVKAESLFRAADVFVLPSVTAKDGDMEGQALVLQEAQAWGVPVVSTRHNGIPEGLIEGETGLLVAERDADELAEAIDHILVDDELRQRMSARGIAFVRERYDVERLNDRLVELYRVLASARAGSPP